MSEFDKKLYWERRKKGVRGQIGYVKAHAVVKDEKGEEQRIPIDYKPGPSGQPGSRARSRQKLVDRNFTKKGFKGHEAGSHFIPPTFELTLTNHNRSVMRKLNRDNQKQQAYQSKAGAGK
jgi:hypothetical protein